MLLPSQQQSAFGTGMSRITSSSPPDLFSSLSGPRIASPTHYSRCYPSPIIVSPPLDPFKNHYHAGAYVTGTSTSLHASYHTTIQTAATTIIPHILSFLKLLMVFTAGGLFFSSVMAWCTATYALGTDNMTRITAMARLVWDNIWMTFTQGLSATKAALLLGDENANHRDSSASSRRSLKWKDAWKVFWQKLRETRLKAVEGVNAMRREANMYAAAVGPPGLIPLQYMLDRLMPYSIATSLEEALQSALDEVETVANGNVQKAKLSYFNAGEEGPKLEAARVYDLGSDAVAFDFDVVWDSAMEATIQVYTAGGLARLPVTLTNAQFHGTVRVVLCPLIKEQPGWGATLYSFPSMPKINMDIRVAGGEVTKVPRLRAELISAIENSIEASMIWPKRAVVPSLGTTKKTVISQSILEKLEKTDPLLEAEVKLGARPMLRRKLNKMTQLLYEDNEADNELLKSIVDLPMPTFQTKDSKSNNYSSLNDNRSRHQSPNLFWDELQKVSRQLQEQTETTLEEARSIQDMFLDQLQHMARDLPFSSSKSSKKES